jgi:hypothetical protein
MPTGNILPPARRGFKSIAFHFDNEVKCGKKDAIICGLKGNSAVSACARLRRRI